jgi:hypothetical protein
MLRGYLLIAAGKNKTVSFSSFMKEGAKFLGAPSGIPMVPCDCYKTHERKGASATRGNYPRNTRRVLQMYCTQLPSMPSMCQGHSRLRRYHLSFLPRVPCLAKCSGRLKVNLNGGWHSERRYRASRIAILSFRNSSRSADR